MRSTTRCDQWCNYPCAKDHRTKAEKIAAMAAGATTPGEKAAAQTALAKHREPATTATNATRRTFTYTYTPPTPEEARPAGHQSNWAYSQFEEDVKQAELDQELLRRAQTRKRVREELDKLSPQQLFEEILRWMREDPTMGGTIRKHTKEE